MVHQDRALAARLVGWSQRQPYSTGFLVALCLAISACSSASQASPDAGSRPTPAERAGADSAAATPYTPADVRFVQTIIVEHAQAARIAGWAPSHGASEDVQSAAGRIAVAERDEAVLLRNWLRVRREAVPDTVASRRRSSGAPLELARATEMAQLDSAHGPEFDRLFLTFMIGHDQRELAAVDQLFASPGAGQGAFIFKFASDLSADHTAEIDRMRAMLTTRGLGGDANH